MNYTLEDIDKVIERTGVGYKEAKNALEKFEGDVVEAIVYLENSTGSINSDGKTKSNGFIDSLIENTKKFIVNLNKTRFIIYKGKKNILNVPLLAALIPTIFFFPPVIAILIIAVITGHKLKIDNVNETVDQINGVFKNVSDSINTMYQKNDKE